MRTRAPSGNAPQLREKGLWRVFPRFKGNGASKAFCEALNRRSETAKARARNENSAAWQSEKARIAEEANRKRSEAAKAQPRSEDGTKLAAKEPEPAQEEFSAEPPAETVEQVVEQTVPAPDNSDKAKKSKASKSKTNRRAVARGGLDII